MLDRVSGPLPISIRGVFASFLCQQIFLPGVVKNGNIPCFSEANDDVDPVFMFVWFVPGRFWFDILHMRKSSEIANKIFSILLVNEPLLEV